MVVVGLHATCELLLDGGRVSGGGLSEHQFGGLLVQPIAAAFIVIGGRANALGLLKLDHHAFGNDRGAVSGDVGNGVGCDGVSESFIVTA